MHLAYTPEANQFLVDDPFALLIGMLLDQQIPMEKAFTSPYELRQRLGHDLDVREIAEYDPAAFEQLFRTPPALHRFPAAMAKRAQALAQVLVEQFDGDPAAVWTGAVDGADLVHRVGLLPDSANKRRAFSSRCSASSSACSHPAGGKPQAHTARTVLTARSPTSWMTTRWRRSASSSSR